MHSIKQTIKQSIKEVREAITFLAPPSKKEGLKRELMRRIPYDPKKEFVMVDAEEAHPPVAPQPGRQSDHPDYCSCLWESEPSPVITATLDELFPDPDPTPVQKFAIVYTPVLPYNLVVPVPNGMIQDTPWSFVNPIRKNEETVVLTYTELSKSGRVAKCTFFHSIKGSVEVTVPVLRRH